MPYTLPDDAAQSEAPKLTTEGEFRALVDWLPMQDMPLIDGELWHGETEVWKWDGSKLTSGVTTVAFDRDGETSKAVVKIEDDPTTVLWETKLSSADIKQIQLDSMAYEVDEINTKRRDTVARFDNPGDPSL